MPGILRFHGTDEEFSERNTLNSGVQVCSFRSSGGFQLFRLSFRSFVEVAFVVLLRWYVQIVAGLSVGKQLSSIIHRSFRERPGT